MRVMDKNLFRVTLFDLIVWYLLSFLTKGSPPQALLFWGSESIGLRSSFKFKLTNQTGDYYLRKQFLHAWFPLFSVLLEPQRIRYIKRLEIWTDDPYCIIQSLNPHTSALVVSDMDIVISKKQLQILIRIVDIALILANYFAFGLSLHQFLNCHDHVFGDVEPRCVPTVDGTNKQLGLKMSIGCQYLFIFTITIFLPCVSTSNWLITFFKNYFWSWTSVGFFSLVLTAIFVMEELYVRRGRKVDYSTQSRGSGVSDTVPQPLGTKRYDNYYEEEEPLTDWVEEDN